MLATFYDTKNDCNVRSDQLERLSYTTDTIAYTKCTTGIRSAIKKVTMFTTGADLVLIKVEAKPSIYKAKPKKK